VYANKTDGKDIVSICAHEDPCGAMHYYLGHDKQEEKTLYVKVNGDTIELKIDYGKQYTPVII